jgi:hypothetical protein
VLLGDDLGPGHVVEVDEGQSRLPRFLVHPEEASSRSSQQAMTRIDWFVPPPAGWFGFAYAIQASSSVVAAFQRESSLGGHDGRYRGAKFCSVTGLDLEETGPA